jgi:hypothetical protein
MKNMRTSAQLLGTRQHDQRIERVSAGPGYRKAISRTLRLGIGIVARAQQAAVPKGLIDVRKALGSRVLKRSFGNKAKAGAGVGKKMAPAAAAAAAAVGRHGGVGISARNVHWYVLGTKRRFTGTISRRNRGRGRYREATGGAIHSTGSMPAHLFLAAAGAAAAGDAKTVMRQALRAELGALWEGSD